ncbi:DUF5765 domain-containing protein [Aliiroseovarius subalbicans]|uniref:DUF5765 domain-containing protein n=1 Tax=Aliiroseovarius subalbicans TaxID=2925840 RepID=UPI001F56F854|nr:DUF5765 domain-containing protein [Aliiroseovarius subalbicans]MCI2399140.1 DUF5765 domain-containing protein [Aliiroseovarius subalbicans]
MCWNTGVSAAMAVGGVVLTVVSARRGDPPAFWMTLGFFTIMEVVQAVSYPVIGQCGQPLNRSLTIFSFGHITLHPFFFNALALAMLPDAARRRVQGWVFALCGIAMIYTIAQLAPLTGNGTCAPHRMMCGTDFCTVPGNWHLAWEMPLNSWGNGLATSDWWLLRQFRDGMVGYGLAVFVLPLLYGAWRITVFQFLIGPILSRLITPNVNEQPAIWCLAAVGIAALIVFTPLRDLFKVQRGPLGHLKHAA